MKNEINEIIKEIEKIEIDEVVKIIKEIEKIEIDEVVKIIKERIETLKSILDYHKDNSYIRKLIIIQIAELLLLEKKFLNLKYGKFSKKP